MVYFETNDLDSTVRALKDAGLVFESDPTDQSWLRREARLLDSDDHEICLYHAGENRLNPPWTLSSASNSDRP